MGALDVSNKKGIGPSNNELRPHRATYEPTVDGGLTTDTYTLFEADTDMLVVVGNIDVKTAFVGATATMTIGVLGGDIDAILASTAVAALLVDVQFDVAAAGKNLLLKKGEKIVVTVGTAAFTAGKIEAVLYMHSR